MTADGFPFTLHPQPRDAHGARVRFECHACGQPWHAAHRAELARRHREVTS